MRQKRQAFALLGVLAFATGPIAADLPEWLERWLYNPRERTLHAQAAGRRGDLGEAAAALETALRLAPDDPVAQYNAGTARLLTGGDAAPLLESAAALGEGTVVPRAFYNLGNARMQAEDLSGAVEAYRDALRRAPAEADAKFNLELAQRLLEEQQRQPSPPPPEEPEPPPEEPQPQPQPDAEQEPEDVQQSPPPDDAGGQQPLPQFRDLPDMTAEEAAAILEAVENMERERRREEAREASKSRARTEKDW